MILNDKGGRGPPPLKYDIIYEPPLMSVAEENRQTNGHQKICFILDLFGGPRLCNYKNITVLGHLQTYNKFTQCIKAYTICKLLPFYLLCLFALFV